VHNPGSIGDKTAADESTGIFFFEIAPAGGVEEFLLAAEENFKAYCIQPHQVGLRSGELVRTREGFETGVLRHVSHLLFDVGFDSRNLEHARRQILRRGGEGREPGANEDAARFHGQSYYAFSCASAGILSHAAAGTSYLSTFASAEHPLVSIE
jgi:hypothetical protein